MMRVAIAVIVILAIGLIATISLAPGEVDAELFVPAPYDEFIPADTCGGPGSLQKNYVYKVLNAGRK